ncbi:hypothetical protein [Gemella haemolysans]|uniref:hypothetical protein n=1 Tax=Gemella haemolysans TaxID=1379 RepID=UPI0023794A3D|nr:hypothetical protein [Gemella haemolysans]
MLEKLFIAGIVTLVVAYFIFIFIEATDYQERKEKEKQEAIELRIKNARLEEKLKALDDKKSEQTKKIAELNGIGG